jgi:hypothetical protein
MADHKTGSRQEWLAASGGDATTNTGRADYWGRALAALFRANEKSCKSGYCPLNQGHNCGGPS